MHGLIDTIKREMRTETAAEIVEINARIGKMEALRDDAQRHLDRLISQRDALLTQMDERMLESERVQGVIIERVLDAADSQLTGFEEQEAVQLAGVLPRRSMLTTDGDYDLQ